MDEIEQQHNCKGCAHVREFPVGTVIPRYRDRSSFANTTWVRYRVSVLNPIITQTSVTRVLSEGVVLYTKLAGNDNTECRGRQNGNYRSNKSGKWGSSNQAENLWIYFPSQHGYTSTTWTFDSGGRTFQPWMWYKYSNTSFNLSCYSSTTHWLFLRIALGSTPYDVSVSITADSGAHRVLFRQSTTAQLLWECLPLVPSVANTRYRRPWPARWWPADLDRKRRRLARRQTTCSASSNDRTQNLGGIYLQWERQQQK